MLRAESPALRSRLLRRPAFSDWRRSLVLLAAIAVLLDSYRDVIRGRQWMLTAILVVALVLATCAILRAVGAPLAWVGGIVVWFVALVWIFVPATLYAVLPTPSSFSALNGLWGRAKDIMFVESTPVSAARPVVYVAAASFGALAVVLDWLVFGLRKPLAVGAIFIGIYVFPTAASGNRPNVPVFVAVAALWLVLLRLETRQMATPSMPGITRGAAPTLAITIAALVVSVALPPALPHVANVAVSLGTPPPGAFDRGINPIVELGQNLRRNSSTTALQYTTTGGRATYLKVATLIDFSGKAWKPGDDTRGGPSDRLIGLNPGIVRTEIKTRITIKHLNSPRLPVPYPALSFDGLSGDWGWESQGLTLRSDSSTSTDQTYTVTSLEVEPTAGQMRDADPFPGRGQRRYLALPGDIPQSIARTAAAVTADATNDYDRAIALQSYFRAGDFIYSETAPVAEGYDGSGVDVIAKFLKAKSGYCVHFSSAMAVMARTLGIPARIAVGYAPGVTAGTTKSGKVLYENTSNDLHAWPELFFEGIGWVNFEPTPGVGSATDFGTIPSGNDVSPDRLPNSATSQIPSRQPDRSLIDNAPTLVSATSTASRSAAVVLVGLLMVLLLPLTLRRGQRWWRLRRSGRTASRLWIELECTARDFSVFVTSSETPRRFAAELDSWPGMDQQSLDRLLSAVERERFGPPGVMADMLADFAVVAACLRSGASRTQRLRAILLPRSLFGQQTYAPRPQTI